MSASNRKCHPSLSISHTCCSPVCTTTQCAPCCSEARATVSFILHVPNGSWSGNGECIAEGKTHVLTELLSMSMLLIAGFSCGSSSLPVWWLTHSFLVLAVSLKANQTNWLWLPKNCLPPVWSNISQADQPTCVVYCNSCLFPGLASFLARCFSWQLTGECCSFKSSEQLQFVNEITGI